MIGKYEPVLAKACWNVFGKSYEYRRKYNDYKEMRNVGRDQMTIWE